MPRLLSSEASQSRAAGLGRRARDRQGRLGEPALLLGRRDQRDHVQRVDVQRLQPGRLVRWRPPPRSAGAPGRVARRAQQPAALERDPRRDLGVVGGQVVEDGVALVVPLLEAERPRHLGQQHQPVGALGRLGRGTGTAARSRPGRRSPTAGSGRSTSSPQSAEGHATVAVSRRRSSASRAQPGLVALAAGGDDGGEVGLGRRAGRGRGRDVLRDLLGEPVRRSWPASAGRSWAAGPGTAGRPARGRSAARPCRPLRAHVASGGGISVGGASRSRTRSRTTYVPAA